MSSSKRVVFGFDERSYNNLQEITEKGHFSSMAETIRDSLRIVRALQGQSEQGFTEVIVRDPVTKAERIIAIPQLVSSAKIHHEGK